MSHSILQFSRSNISALRAPEPAPEIEDDPVPQDAGRSAELPYFSVVIPVYNSARILPELYERLTRTLQAMGRPYEVIFVDDCGRDHSWQVLQGLVFRHSDTTVVQLMRNSGQSNATLCGLSHARGQIIVTMDDDLQHPPEEIPALVQALGSDADVVMGVPIEKKHNLFRRVGSDLMHRLNSRLLGKDPHLRFTSFRVLRRPVVEGMLHLRTLSPALGPMINSITHRIRNVTVEHAPRKEGRSGYTFKRLVMQTLNNVVGYSMLPLRLLGLVGGIGILCSMGMAAWLLVHYVSGGVVPGWTSTVMLLLLLSSFNFFAFAVIGEYVLRILQRVNATPQYLVRNALSSVPDEELRHAR